MQVPTAGLEPAEIGSKQAILTQIEGWRANQVNITPLNCVYFGVLLDRKPGRTRRDIGDPVVMSADVGDRIAHFLGHLWRISGHRHAICAE